MAKNAKASSTRLGRIFRRYKWFIILAWVLIAVVATPISAKLTKSTTSDPTVFLPQGTQSTQVAKILATNDKTSQISAVIVYTSPTALTDEQKSVIAKNTASLQKADIPGFLYVTPTIYSQDGKAAFYSAVFAAPQNDQEFAADTAEKIAQVIPDSQSGMEVRITGQIGVAADIGTGGDTKLLITTIVIIAILLLITYRSPILWILPLTAAWIATTFAQSIIYALTLQGFQVDTVVVSILLVLVFGAATDYALLILSRYREELHLKDDKHEAIAAAMRGTTEAIAASALTVTLALLALLLASNKSSQGLAIVGALGILSAFLVQMTLLPAVLAVFGRKLLWPRIPRNDGSKFEGSNFWHKLSNLVARRPRRIAVGITALLFVGALGLFTITYTSDPSAGIRGNPPSVQGQKMLEAHFPAGSSNPLVIVASSETAANQAKDVITKESVVSVTTPITAVDDTHYSFNVTLTTEPYSDESYAAIKTIRIELVSAGLTDVLVGGSQAVQYDTQQTALRDNKVIIPLILLIVTVVLALLLRAVPAPLMLLATVILSFAFSFGVSVLVFEHIFKFPGVDPGVPLFSFLFIVALGVDYNIFLMDRARQETKNLGTKQGILKSLRVTGGVITAAGLVLAGTFAALAQIPFVVLTELGFAIAFGIIIDSFLVRSMLVPALVILIGKRTWWPTKAKK